MIRRDVKIIQKQEDKELGISEDSDDQNEWEEKINHKVQYGTDTDSELEEAYWMEVDKRKAIQLQQEEEYESEEDYDQNIAGIRDIIKGNFRRSLEQFKSQMEH